MADTRERQDSSGSHSSTLTRLIVLALVVAAAYQYFKPAAAPTPAPDPCPVSRSMAAQIRSGMTREQVIQTVGCQPKGQVNLISNQQATSENSGGQLKERLIWNSSTGRLEVAIDRQGKVINSWFTGPPGPGSSDHR